MTTNFSGILTDPNQKPTEPFDREWAFLEQEMWAGALTAMAEAYSFYTQTYDIWPDRVLRGSKARPEYHSPLDQSLIKNAVNAHLAYHPTYHREPNGVGAANKEAADRVEKALAVLVIGAFNNFGGSQPGIPPKVNGTQMQLCNHTSIFTGWNYDALRKPVRKDRQDKEDFERQEWEWGLRNTTWNPIKIEVPGPGEVLFTTTDARPPIAIRKKVLKAYELADWTMKVEQRGRGKAWEMGQHDPYDPITFYERWTSRWVAVMESGKLLAVEDNPYWMNPFLQSWGGDIVAVAGKEFNIEQWVRQAMIFREMDTLKMLNQNIASKHEVLVKGSFAKTIYAGDPAVYAAQQDGDIMGGIDPDDVAIEKLAQLPGEMFNESQELLRHLELGSYSMQAAGYKETGIRTATEALSLAQAVNRTFLGTVNRLESLYTSAGENVLMIYYRLAKHYPVEDSSQLKIRDLGEPAIFRCEAKFEQIDAAVREAERATAMASWREGFIDHETALKQAGYENPSEILAGIVEDRVKQMPEVLAEQEITALVAMGYEELAERKKEEAMQRRAQIGLVGPDGAPIAGANGQTPTQPTPGGNGRAVP